MCGWLKIIHTDNDNKTKKIIKCLNSQLDRAHDQIVVPLEGFRKDAIGSVKEKKKQHDKKTAKFCQAQEKILNLSSKKPETVVVEVIKMIFLELLVVQLSMPKKCVLFESPIVLFFCQKNEKNF